MLTDKINYLSSFVLDQRMQQLEKVLALRTRYISVCLEDIYQSQNVSAVLRTCDACGIQDVHIVEDTNEYHINKGVALGTDKWLNIYKYHTGKDGQSPTDGAINALRNKGYRIVATTPHNASVTVNEFDFAKGKFALFFGTELTGLSAGMMAQADEFVHIPMYGFVESFNVSVSASILLYNLATQLRQSDCRWQLPDNECDEIMFRWLRSSVRSADLLLKRYDEAISMAEKK